MSDWSETASADNTLATATHAANSRLKNRILGVAAVFDKAVNGPASLQVKFGAVVVLDMVVQPGQSVSVPFKKTAAVNEAISAELAASGTALDLGHVNIWGDDLQTTLISG